MSPEYNYLLRIVVDSDEEAKRSQEAAQQIKGVTEVSFLGSKGLPSLPVRTPSEWLTRGEAAAYVGVTYKTFSEYVKAGGVPEHRMAGGTMGKRKGKIAYRRDELDAFRAGR